MQHWKMTSPKWPEGFGAASIQSAGSTITAIVWFIPVQERVDDCSADSLPYLKRANKTARAREAQF